MLHVSGPNQSSDPEISAHLEIPSVFPSVWLLSRASPCMACILTSIHINMYELLTRLYKGCMNSECKQRPQDRCFKLSQKLKEWKQSPDVSETEATLTWEDQLHTRVRRRQHEIVWRHGEQGLFGPPGEKRFHPPSNIEQNQSFCILCFPLITWNWWDEHFHI